MHQGICGSWIRGGGQRGTVVVKRAEAVLGAIGGDGAVRFTVLKTLTLEAV